MTKFNRISCASFLLICVSLCGSDLQIAAEEFIYRDSLELKEYPKPQGRIETVSGAMIRDVYAVNNHIYFFVEAANYLQAGSGSRFSDQHIDHLVSMNLDSHELKVMTFDSDSRSRRDFGLLFVFDNKQILFSTVGEGKYRGGESQWYRKDVTTGDITPIELEYDAGYPRFVHIDGVTASIVANRDTSILGSTTKVKISGFKERNAYTIDTLYGADTDRSIFALDDVSRLGPRSQMSPGNDETQLMLFNSRGDQDGPCGIDAYSLTDNEIKWSIPARAFEEKIGKQDLVAIVPADHIRYPSERFPVTLMFKDNTSYLGIVSRGKIEWVRKVPDFPNWRFTYVSPNSRYVVVTDRDYELTKLSLIDCEKQLILPTLPLRSAHRYDEPVAVAADGTVILRTRNGFRLAKYSKEQWTIENVRILLPHDHKDNRERQDASDQLHLRSQPVPR